jgi:hypothetical protein
MATLHIPHAKVAQQRDGISMGPAAAYEKQEYVCRPAGPGSTSGGGRQGTPHETVKGRSAASEKRRRVSRPNIESMVDKTRRGWKPERETWFDPATYGSWNNRFPF